MCDVAASIIMYDSLVSFTNCEHVCTRYQRDEEVKRIQQYIHTAMVADAVIATDAIHTCRVPVSERSKCA